MASENALVLIQLSDVHFGGELITEHWNRFLYQGYDAHDHQLCQALPTGIKDALRELQFGPGRDYTLIVSGDLTVSGTAPQFERALSYLHDTQPWDPRDPSDSWGLAQPRSRARTVPGNHDHWDGVVLTHISLRRPRGFNPALFPPARFLSGGRAPFRRHPWGLALGTDTLRLELLGLDSLSGFSDQDTNLRAGGRLQERHLTKLDKLVAKLARCGASSERVVRCLVMHHPTHSSAVNYMAFDADSRRELLASVAKHRIAVVLTGHRHSFDAGPVPAYSAPTQPPWEAWEIRAPSTLQGPARIGVQGFVAHKLEILDDSVAWTYRPWIWSGDRYELWDSPEPLQLQQS